MRDRGDDLMLQEMVGQKVVVDLSSPYVCLGTLLRFDEHFLELKNADLHDLRDTDSTREIYVAESHTTGIKRNRKRVLLARAEMVAIARLDDIAGD
jgi:hypothetical protein